MTAADELGLPVDAAGDSIRIAAGVSLHRDPVGAVDRMTLFVETTSERPAARRCDDHRSTVALQHREAIRRARKRPLRLARVADFAHGRIAVEMLLAED
jgi:hypothetical protein